MKTKKQFTNRILSLVLALVMVVGMVPMTVSAASSGKCGDNITWSLSNDGTLTLSGSGVMYDKGSSDIPWYDQKGSIKKVVIENGITWIDQYSFYACNNLTQVVIHGNTKLSGFAFYGCGALTSVSYGGTVNRIEGSNAFAYCKKLSSFTLLEGVGKSGDAFFDCKNLSVKNIKLVDANGNDKTEYYTKTITINMATKSNPLTIKGNLAKGSIESIPDQQYTGGEVKPAVTVKWNGQTVSSSNYDVAYSNNIEPGTATVTVKGKDANYYTGTLTQTFTILEPEEMTSVSAQNVTATYDGNAHGITVTGAPADATITYSGAQDGTYTGTQPAIVNVADSGTIYYKVTAQGYKEFNGSASVTISPRNIADCQVQDISAQTYTGSVITPDVTVTYGNKTLTQDDYSIFGDSVNAGSGSVTITGKGNFEGTTTKYFQITTANIADTTITIDPENGTYTGNAYTPSVSVTFNGAPLVKDSDYILSWDKSGFTAPGTYTVRVVGIGNFTGYVDKTFNISAANLTDVKVEQIGTLTYDGGNALTPTVSANAVSVNNQPITFTYSTEQNGTYGSMPSFTEAGTYTVYFKATAPNHNDATGSFTVTVDKATVTEPTIASKPYNGAVQTADITDTDFYTVVENNGGTGVKLNGYYDVVLELKDAANYKWSSTNDARVTLKFEIKRATNEWTTTPSISGWTYGENANTPVGVAKFGDVSIQYIGTANDGTQINSTTAPTKAGNYTATFIVAETEDYRGLETSVDFTIAKATYDMTGAKWDYTEAIKYDGKAHKVEVIGLPSGVIASGYNGNTATVMGNYTAKVTLSYDSNNYNAPYVADLNWKIENNWTPTEYTVSTPNGNGWLNKDFVITAADGYKVSLTNTADGEWSNSLTYSGETADGNITFYLKNETDGTISLAKTVSYKLDKTVPTGKVEFVNRTGWEEFVNTITFGLFYKDEVTVKVTENDNLSGIAKIEYASADKAMTLDQVKAITDWTEYNGEFGVTLEDAKKFVYFVRITDKAGNVTYLSTNGAEYDTTAPVISDVENGKTYYTTQKVTVTDKNIDSITLNGETAGNEITLDGNKEATYTIVATDKAGNTTTVTVTMKPISDLSAPIDTLTKDNVNSGNESVVDGVKAAVAAVDTTNATEAEKQALKDIADKVAELEKVIDDTKAEIARINEELNKYDGDTVNSDNAAALEQIGKDIKALTDGNNLTDAERTALTEDADDVAAMQKTVTDTVAENDRISDAVDGYDLATVTSDDKDDLEQLLSDIEKQLESTNLTEEEISELNGDKKAVEDLLTKVKGTDELIDKLTGDVDGYSDDTVKSTDKDAIEQIIEDIDALLETENLTEDEKKALDDAKAKAEKLLDTIEDAAKAPNTENTEKVKDVTAENVTLEDKTDLEKAKDDLEKALEDNGGNYTEDEKKAIEDEIKRIEDALEVIGNVEAVEELIDKLPENITKNDENAIKAADDAYNALSDYEKSLVDEDAKKALDDAKTALAELNKPADTTSPNTGDNSNLWLSVDLLFVSGGVVITLTVVDKKRRMASKR